MGLCTAQWSFCSLFISGGHILMCQTPIICPVSHLTCFCVLALWLPPVPRERTMSCPHSIALSGTPLSTLRAMLLTSLCHISSNAALCRLQTHLAFCGCQSRHCSYLPIFFGTLKNLLKTQSTLKPTKAWIEVVLISAS